MYLLWCYVLSWTVIQCAVICSAMQRYNCGTLCMFVSYHTEHARVHEGAQLRVADSGCQSPSFARDTRNMQRQIVKFAQTHRQEQRLLPAKSFNQEASEQEVEVSEWSRNRSQYSCKYTPLNPMWYSFLSSHFRSQEGLNTEQSDTLQHLLLTLFSIHWEARNSPIPKHYRRVMTHFWNDEAWRPDVTLQAFVIDLWGLRTVLRCQSNGTRISEQGEVQVGTIVVTVAWKQPETWKPWRDKRSNKNTNSPWVTRLDIGNVH